MFSGCVLMAIMDTKGKTMNIRRIVENRETQGTTNATLASAAAALTDNRTAVEFDGKYNPQSEDMEYLTINNYLLPVEIKEAIHNPQGLERYLPEDGKMPPIRALFLGKFEEIDGKEQYTVAFQKVRSHQYITAEKHHIFWSGDTYVTDTRQGISIIHSVDCVYINGQLQFRSYHFARQVLDLSQYYREASNHDVECFVKNSIMQMENNETFVGEANSWERRKIAAIMDAGTLSRFTAIEIKNRAKKSGVKLIVSGGKILLPADRAERKLVLAFLDEEVYKGPFTDQVFQTNSKRIAQ